MARTNTLGRILMVEDDPKDVELTLTALEDYNLANEVVVTRDGEQALDYLYHRGEFKARANGNPAFRPPAPPTTGWRRRDRRWPGRAGGRRPPALRDSG